MASAKRIICVGHAALDRIYRIEAFPPHPTKVRALEHIEAGGGMAANAAVAIARLGGAGRSCGAASATTTPAQTIRAGLRAEQVDVRYVQAFEGARSSTSAIIVDDKGERLIVGQRDAGMPSDTSWLPLERVKTPMPCSATSDGSRACAPSLRRPARTRCRPCSTPISARARPWSACCSSPTMRSSPRRRCASSRPRRTDAERLQHVLSLGPKHAGVTLGAKATLWCERDGSGHVAGVQRERHRHHRCRRRLPRHLRPDAGRGHMPPAERARLAAAAAALKCTRLGSRAGLPSRAELEAFAAGAR